MTLGIIGHIAFFVLVIIAGFDAGARRAAIFIALWALGYVATDHLASPMASGLVFGSYVAVLDIALLLTLKLGNLRLH